MRVTVRETGIRYTPSRSCYIARAHAATECRGPARRELRNFLSHYYVLSRCGRAFRGLAARGWSAALQTGLLHAMHPTAFGTMPLRSRRCRWTRARARIVRVLACTHVCTAALSLSPSLCYPCIAALRCLLRTRRLAWADYVERALSVCRDTPCRIFGKLPASFLLKTIDRKSWSLREESL